MTKQDIIHNIHTLVSHNVIGDKQLINRYKGFKGELSFETYLKSNYNRYKLLDGGMIFSIDSSKSSINNSVYITVTNQINNLNDYINLYSNLHNLDFKHLFLVVYENKHWEQKPVMIYPNETIKLPVPKLKIMTYDIENKKFLNTSNSISQFTNLFEDLPERKKSSYPISDTSIEYLLKMLNPFDINDLIKIYLNRLFLDGYIGFSKKKGKISDIDLILKRPHGEYRLIEIKEKDLAKKIIGFGLDTPRLEDMNTIQTKSKLDYYLTVRHINNQKDRELIGWKMISINDFSKNVKGQKTTEGGTGMRSTSSKNPTVICQLKHFKEI